MIQKAIASVNNFLRPQFISIFIYLRSVKCKTKCKCFELTDDRGRQIGLFCRLIVVTARTTTMKTYPTDLRSQIVTAYKNKEGSMLKLACHFGVSRSFVQKIIHQEQTTGTVEPLVNRGKQPKLLAYQNRVREIVRENPGATYKELCKILEQQINIKVSPSTLSRFLRKIS